MKGLGLIMEKNKGQNAMLVTTCVNEKGNTELTYIPLGIDYSMIDFFLKHGTCTNKEAINFEIDIDAEIFWKNMWKALLNGEE